MENNARGLLKNELKQISLLMFKKMIFYVAAEKKYKYKQVASMTGFWYSQKGKGTSGGRERRKLSQKQRSLSHHAILSLLGIDWF